MIKQLAAAVLIVGASGVAVHISVKDRLVGDDAWTWFVIGSVAMFVVAILIGRMTRPKGDLGSARLATSKDIEKSGLWCKSGVLIGSFKSRNIVYGGDGHVGVVAGTRSGKGVSFVIPNLLLWPGSCFVFDPKEENWEATARHRAKFTQVVKLDWLSPDQTTDGYNPMSFVRRDPRYMIDDLQLIATELLPDEGGSERMWVSSARELFLGISLFLFHNREEYGTERYGVSPGEITLEAVRKILVCLVGAQKAMEDIVEVGKTVGLHDEALRLLGKMANMNPKQFSGVESTLATPLAIFASPVVSAATRESTFDPADMRRKRMSIYLVVRVPDVDNLRSLTRIFIRQTVNRLSRKLPGPDEPHKVLMALDEFASLGKMDTLLSAIALLAGYNVQMALVFQSLGQLRELYGEGGAQTFWENMDVHVMFAPNGPEQARAVSEAVGQTTVDTSSVSGKVLEGVGSRSRSRTTRALMTTDEVRRLGEDELLIFVKHAPAIRSQKVKYFLDRLFKGLWFDVKFRSNFEMYPEPAPRVQVSTPEVAENVTVSLEDVRNDLLMLADGDIVKDAVSRVLGETT